MMRLLFVMLAGMLFTSAVHAQKQFGFDNRKSSGQDYLSPEETVKRMKTAPEFEVKLFAGEPNCVNPIAFTLDEKGRVWMVECFEYPSRTPPGRAPRDRIVILEDTDGDGACDKRTVFAEGKDFPVPEERRKAGLGAFDMASGIEVGYGGVYVGAPPYLWFIENKNDKPGKFETLLSGFGSQDTHETLNTFQWGPDGWLYGLHGVFTQSTVKSLDGPETRLNGAIWRYHPKTKKFEVFAEGTSNPWGMDWRNTDGQFILACCVIPHLYHIVPGGIYRRQAGASFNPYVYDYIQEICDHTFHKESGWAHAGLISLDVPYMPKKYRNSVIFGSIHGCSIKQNILKPNGSSYIASRGDDFLVSGDKNFRPINMKWGPNGDIYLIDWHDQNPCHQAKPDSWDYERGRVYRIQLKGTKLQKARDLSRKTPEELIALLGHDNPYYYRTALRLLANMTLDQQTINTLLKSAKLFDPKKAPRLALASHILGAADSQHFNDMDENNTNKPIPSLSTLSIRTVADSSHTTAKTIAGLTVLAKHSPQTAVRRELASAAIALADQHDVTSLLHTLLLHQEDHDDPLIPYLIWIAYEKVLAHAEQQKMENELTWIARNAPGNALIRDQIVPNSMRRLVATGKQTDLARCLNFIDVVDDPATRAKALEGMILALDKQTVTPPKAWQDLQQKLTKDARLQPLVNKLAVNFRDPEAIKRAVAVLINPRNTVEARVEAVQQLTTVQAPEARALFPQILSIDSQEQVRIEAARGLAAFADAGLAIEVLKNWKKYPPSVRMELVNVLASRKDWAKDLLHAVEMKTVSSRDITDNTIVRVQAFQDKDLNTLIEKAWGRTRPTPDQLNATIDKMREELNQPGVSFARGKLVFEMQCAKCHKFDGKGAEVGPVLDGAARDIEYILANVIDPNRVIGAPYFQRIAKTIDGRVEQGLLVAEDDTTMTLKVENGQLKKIRKDDLDGPVTVLEKSMMPEGITAGMTIQNFRDLVRYVMANPYITEAVMNGKPIRAGTSGLFRFPERKERGPATIEATVTTKSALKTKVLIGSRDRFQVLIDGKAVGEGSGSGTRLISDADSLPIVITPGRHTLTIRTSYQGADGGLYVRFLDPDRQLTYPDPGVKE